MHAGGVWNDCATRLINTGKIGHFTQLLDVYMAYARNALPNIEYLMSKDFLTFAFTECHLVVMLAPVLQLSMVGTSIS